jgi:hypothetical protein
LSENKKLELLDQYDDVTFALLMDEYAEEEGARLRKEFEEAQAAGKVSDTPDALDEKCLQMIHRDFAKKRGKENVRKIIRMTSKVAVAVLVFFGVVTATIFSVDALRIPVLTFFVEHFDGFMSINSNENQELHSKDPCMMLADLLSDDYYQIDYSFDENLEYVLYENNQGETVTLSIYAPDMEMNIDNEDAEYSEVNIGDYRAILLNKNGWNMIWSDDSGKTYMFRASDFTQSQVLELCNILAMHIKL